jgi:hypothetical protein
MENVCDNLSIKECILLLLECTGTGGTFDWTLFDSSKVS